MTESIHEARGDVVEACPECESARLRRRTPDHPASPAHQTHRWNCVDCGLSFDDPVERPRRQPGARSGLARELVDADPDAIGGD